MTNMKAAVIYNAGGPDVLKLEECPVPDVKPGWVLVRVRTFGLNRSELFTRQGHSPNVHFPAFRTQILANFRKIFCLLSQCLCFYTAWVRNGHSCTTSPANSN